MALATHDVISVPPTTTIIGAVEAMTSHGFRRLPITDAGTMRLRGIVTAGDIINFMGGGDKFNLVNVKHRGNLLAAINDSVREIMTEHLITISPLATIDEVVETIVTKKTGGLPIIGDDDVLVGIVTERDVMLGLSREKNDRPVEEIMSTELHVITPDAPIGAVTREMVSGRFRRLPVVSEDILFGIITATDIMKYLGSGEVFEKLETGNIADVMGLPVRTLIERTLHTATPDQTVTEVAAKMVDKHVGALPVIENSHLIGIVTEFDLVKALAKR
jgi:CBS domain-containing protein